MQSIENVLECALQSISCMQAVLHASIDAFPIAGNWSPATRCFIVFEIESGKSPAQRNPCKYMDEPSMNTKTTAIFRKHDLINSGLVNNSWQFYKFPSLEKNTCQLPRDAHLRSCGPNGWLLLRRACSNYQGCHLRELMMIFYPRQNGWKKEMFYWKKPTIR